MEEQTGVPATRIVVNADRLREIAAEKGFRNVEQIVERARELGITLSLSTVYGVMGNRNFQRDTVEKLAEVIGCGLDEFVTFEPEPSPDRRD